MLATGKKKQSLRQKTIFIKLRFNNFETTTLQIPATLLDECVFYNLCKKARQKGSRSVRLIGIGLRFYPPDISMQLELSF
jgi:DNA polymerase-4